MLEALATPRSRILTLAFLAIGCAAVAGAVGISDDPPGIVLVLGAAVAFVLASARR